VPTTVRVPELVLELDEEDVGADDGVEFDCTPEDESLPDSALLDDFGVAPIVDAPAPLDGVFVCVGVRLDGSETCSAVLWVLKPSSAARLAIVPAIERMTRFTVESSQKVNDS
jgi:hypothetical protein